jgi:hypothetical protein
MVRVRGKTFTMKHPIINRQKRHLKIKLENRRAEQVLFGGLCQWAKGGCAERVQEGVHMCVNGKI